LLQPAGDVRETAPVDGIADMADAANAGIQTTRATALVGDELAVVRGRSADVANAWLRNRILAA